MGSKALIPVRQALVPFHGHKVLSIRLQDDHVAAYHTALCRLLKLDRDGQMQRIRRDAVLTGQLLQVVVQTPGGPQTIDVLTAWAIPSWLNGLNPEMVAPEKRPMILKLKLEAADVLYRYFFKIDTDSDSRPAADEPAAPQETRPGAGATAHKLYNSSFDMIAEGLDLAKEGWREMHQEQQQLETQIRSESARSQAAQANLALRLVQLEQGYQPEAATREVPPLGQGLLSPEHVGHLVVLARSAHASTGEPIKAIYAELEEVFDVEHFSDIPDAGWDVVQEWFLRRGQEA